MMDETLQESGDPVFITARSELTSSDLARLNKVQSTREARAAGQNHGRVMQNMLHIIA